VKYENEYFSKRLTFVLRPFVLRRQWPRGLRRTKTMKTTIKRKIQKQHTQKH
jgi:hypothetical protein